MGYRLHSFVALSCVILTSGQESVVHHEISHPPKSGFEMIGQIHSIKVKG